MLQISVLPGMIQAKTGHCNPISLSGKSTLSGCRCPDQPLRLNFEGSSCATSGSNTTLRSSSVAEEVYNMQILKSVAQKYRNSKSISNISKKNQKYFYPINKQARGGSLKQEPLILYTLEATIFFINRCSYSSLMLELQQNLTSVDRLE